MSRNTAWCLTMSVTHVVIAFAGGCLVVRHGGSVDRAPDALRIALVVLGGSGLCAGTLYGALHRREALRADAMVALAAHYCASWAFTRAHSPLGDVLFVVLSGVPLALGTASGYSVGKLLRRFIRTAVEATA